MKFFAFLFCMVLSSGMGISCLSPEKAFGDTAGGERLDETVYEDPHGFFRIVPPKDWGIKEYPSDPRGKVKFTGPERGVSILVLGRVSDLSSFHELELAESASGQRVVDKYQHLNAYSKEEQSTLDGAPLHKFTIVIPNRFKSEGYAFLRGTAAYTYSFAGPPHLFEKYYDIAMKSFQSIEPIIRERPADEAIKHIVASRIRVAELNIADGRQDIALRAIREGLEIDPGNEKLKELKKLLEN